MQVVRAPSPEKQLQYLRSIVPDADLKTLPEGCYFLNTGLHPDPVLLDYSMYIRPFTTGNTPSLYLYEIGKLLSFLESLGASWRDVTEDQLRAYRELRTSDHEAKRVSARTWQRCRAAINGFFRFLYARGYLESMPYQVIGGNSVLGGRRMNFPARARALSKDRWGNFVNTGLRKETGTASRTELRDVAAAKLMTSSGLRIGETSLLLVLEIEAAEADHGQLELEEITKRSRFRMVTLTPGTLSQIRLYQRLERSEVVERFAHQEVDTAELFVVTESKNGRVTGAYRGKSRSYKLASMPPEMRRIAVSIRNGRIEPLGLFLSTSSARLLSTGGWHKAFRKANIEVSRTVPGWSPVKPHDLRHTFANNLGAVAAAAAAESQKNKASWGNSATLTDRLGMDYVGRVQRALGHASPNTTAIYLQSPHDGDGEFSDALDAWADGGELK